MPDLQDLLLHGFTPDYTPLDVANETRDALLATTSDHYAEQAPVLMTASDLVDHYTVLLERCTVVVDAMAATFGAPTTAVLPDGTSVTLPTPAEYRALSVGSPDLVDIERLKRYELHHLSAAGNLNVFVWEDAVALQDELRHIISDPTITTALPATTTGPTPRGHDHPLVMVWDYYEYRAEQVMHVIADLETAAMPYLAELPETTLRDLLGDDDPTMEVLDAWDDVRTQCTSVKSYLQLMKSILRLYTYTATLEVATALDKVKTWVHNYIAQALNQAKVAMLAAIYEQLLKPAIDFAIKSAIDPAIVLPGTIGSMINKTLAHMQADALGGVLGELRKLQRKLIELAREDTFRYRDYRAKSRAISTTKRARCYLTQVEKIEAYLDRILAAANPDKAILEALMGYLPKLKKAMSIPNGWFGGGSGDESTAGDSPPEGEGAHVGSD